MHETQDNLNHFMIESSKDNISTEDKINDDMQELSKMPVGVQNKDNEDSDDLNSITCNDVGNYIGKKIDDYTKFQLLENPWIPPNNFKFPVSYHKKNEKIVKRSANLHHFEKYKWLVFSKEKNGLFCKFCPWFSKPSGEGRHGMTHLLKLVTVPITSFAKLTGKSGDLDVHNERLYHKSAVEAGKNFLTCYHNPKTDVMSQVNEKYLAEILENRARLKPIVESIIFLGRQNIAFRGHRDDGNLNMFMKNNNEKSTVNEGNFKALLTFRVKSGDTDLEKHLINTSSRATYISKTTQNDIISCCGKEITDKIIKNVKESNLYSVLFDETTDLSHKSQISLILRYVHKSQEIREDFIGFIDAFDEGKSMIDDKIDEINVNVEDTQLSKKASVERGKEISLTGKTLGQIVLRQLKCLDLPLNCLVGIGTDGCSVMISERKGAVAEIQNECVNALKCSCMNHRLNLSLSKSSEVTSVRNSVGIMKVVISFFTSSAKRNAILVRCLHHQLSGLCETRWVERHDGIIQFFTDLPNIINALEEISTWKDTATSSKAKSLITSLCDNEFLIAMNCLSDILALTLPLSKQLQKLNLDLKKAAELLLDSIKILEERRINANDYFRNGIWIRVKTLASQLNIEIKKPRCCSRQKNRANFETNSVEDYYRLSIFIPLLDNVIMDLNSRFDSSTFDVFHLPLILPNCAIESMNNEELKEESLKKLINRFYPLLDIPDESTGLTLFKNEFELWRRKWIRDQSSIPNTVIEALLVCDKDVYPIINKLLQLLATLPVSNASAERTFSTLRRLKNWLRSTMNQDRLTGLALLNIHNGIPVETENIITRFAKTGKRRFNLLL